MLKELLKATRDYLNNPSNHNYTTLCDVVMDWEDKGGDSQQASCFLLRIDDASLRRELKRKAKR